MNHKVLSIVLIFLCCWAVFWIVWVSGTTKTRQWTWATPTPPPPPPPSRFLYLLQTESCLPDGLRSIEALGNATACHCDVLVLSCKQTCNDTPPAHVEYISASSRVPTSWSEGRNLLFGVAMGRSEKYLYYIFMDDDLHLKSKSHHNRDSRNLWRVFETFLRRIEPAVGALDTNEDDWVRRAYKARQLLGCSIENHKNIRSFMMQLSMHFITRLWIISFHIHSILTESPGGYLSGM